MGIDFRDFDKNSSDDSETELTDEDFMDLGPIESDNNDEQDNESDTSDVELPHHEDENKKYDIDEDENEEDEVVKAIKAEKTKPRDHPPAIICEDFIVDISFSPSKNLIALANIMGDVLLYEYNNDETKLVNTFELHVKACRDVEFDDTGDIMFTAGKDKAIIVTDIETGKLKQCYENAHEEAIYSLLCLGNDKFVTGDDGGTVKLWDLRKSNPLFSIKIGEEYVSEMITNDTQKYLVCAGGDGVLTSIDLKGGKIHTTSEEYDAELTCMGLFRSDKILSQKGFYHWRYVQLTIFVILVGKRQIVLPGIIQYHLHQEVPFPISAI
ncbi:unnamed protein product, partial [Iphiclides podalirius]